MTGGEQVIEFIEAEAPTALIPKLRDMLGAFLFRGDDVYKPVSVLSGGEKNRLALLRMLLKPMNLLILDEPTNHLDLHSKDILLDTLRKFQGTIIFVSHDRAFMEALSTKTLELSPAAEISAPAKTRLFFGNYAYYLDRLNRDAAGEKDTVRPAVTAAASSLNSVTRNSAAETRELDKQKQALIRRLERQEGEILKTLENMESEKLRLETELARPEVYSNGDKVKVLKLKLDQCSAAIEAKTGEWEKLTTELKTAGADVFT